MSMDQELQEQEPVEQIVPPQEDAPAQEIGGGEGDSNDDDGGDIAAQQPAADPEIERRARNMGWRPKEEYNGPDDNWRDAKEFVDFGEQQIPIMRERLRTMESKVEQRDREHQETVTRMQRANEIALVNQRNNIFQDFERQKRAAAEYGDVDQFDALTRQQQENLHHFDTQMQQAFQPPQQPYQQASAQGPDPDESLFVARNPWFETDPEMRGVAVSVSQSIGGQNPDMPKAEVLRQTESRIRQMYPQKFQTTQRPAGAPAVASGGGRAAVTTRQGKGAHSLPAEARNAGKRFVEDGIFKSLDEYAKAYYENE